MRLLTCHEFSQAFLRSIFFNNDLHAGTTRGSKSRTVHGRGRRLWCGQHERRDEQQVVSLLQVGRHSQRITLTPCHRSWASPMQQHLSVVPYQGHGPGRPHGCGYCSGDCCAPFYPSHCSQQSLQVALPMPSNIEERLRALEGDKDQLHIQVLILSKNCI